MKTFTIVSITIHIFLFLVNEHLLDTKTFESLQECSIIDRIKAETGDVYSRIYSYFQLSRAM